MTATRSRRDSFFFFSRFDWYATSLPFSSSYTSSLVKNLKRNSLWENNRITHCKIKLGYDQIGCCCFCLRCKMQRSAIKNYIPTPRIMLLIATARLIFKTRFWSLMQWRSMFPCVFTSGPLLLVLSGLFGGWSRHPALVAAGSKASLVCYHSALHCTRFLCGCVLCRIPNGASSVCWVSKGRYWSMRVGFRTQTKHNNCVHFDPWPKPKFKESELCPIALA